MMSSLCWWSMCPVLTPIAEGEIKTYGFVSDPVAWQIVTLSPATAPEP